MKLFVCRLPYETTERELRELFEKWGQVTECAIATDRDTGNPKGYGFVTMPISMQAEEAVRQLSGTKVGGRTILVEASRNQEDRHRPRPYDTRGARR